MAWQKCHGKCGHPKFHQCPGQPEKCGMIEPSNFLCNPRFSTFLCPTQHLSRNTCEQPTAIKEFPKKKSCAGKIRFR